MRLADTGLHRHRNRPVACLPVLRQALQRLPQDVAGQILHPHALADQKAVVGHQAGNVVAPRALIPAQQLVAGGQPQRSGHPAEDAEVQTPGPDAVHQSAAGGQPASQRMFRRQQGGPVAALLGRVGPAQAHLAQLLERAPDLHTREGLPDHLRRAAGTASGAAAGSRQGKTEIPGQLRQALAGRGCAQLAQRIAPLVPLTQLASQLRPGERSALEFAAQPLDRGRLQHAETDAHYCRSTQPTLNVSSPI